MTPVAKLATSGVMMLNFWNRTPERLDALYEEAKIFFAIVMNPQSRICMRWERRTCPSPGGHKISSITWPSDATLEELALAAVQNGYFEGIPDSWTVEEPWG